LLQTDEVLASVSKLLQQSFSVAFFQTGLKLENIPPCLSFSRSDKSYELAAWPMLRLH